MQVADYTQIRTLGALRDAGYQSRSIKDELRQNLIHRIKNKMPIFEGIHGYEDTVIPDVERALLSRHNMILLGLRGQAKTRLARMMVALLDEYIPYIEGSDLFDDPFHPISHHGMATIAEKGDETPIVWLHRDERYVEKLATPDVSVADLIGDVDPIKAANMRLSYADERVLHFGLVPRSNRCIFVINELPDLQARIQVALFNILQEGDIQIRGFKLRMPLDIQFVFTANPEDYTNRGSIVTPLKDRIESQILTHYPKTIEISKLITIQEARLTAAQKENVQMDDLAHDLVEQIAVEARSSEYVDQNSGVSARLTISAYENLISAAERRALLNGESHAHVRIADLWGVIPAITGKIELVYEGEQEGPSIVAQNLIGKAIRGVFPLYFPSPEKFKRSSDDNPYSPISRWFSRSNSVDLMHNLNQEEYQKVLMEVPGLEAFVKGLFADESPARQLFLMEFVLHGMAEFSLISKNGLEAGLQFGDIISGMFSGGFDPGEFEE